MPKLRDGTIIPSNESIYNPSEYNLLNDARFNNGYLRIGTVTDIYYPDDDRNQNKKFTEYKVICEHIDGQGALIPTPYICMLSTQFGSKADYIDYSLRSQEEFLDPSSGGYISNGAIVTILCANGRGSDAFIIGAVQSPRRNANSSSDGKYFIFEFNGIKGNIDNDGAFTLTQRGPTDITGDPGFRTTGDSVISIDSNGSIKLTDGGAGLGESSIFIDKTSSSINLNAAQSIGLSSTTGTTIQVGTSFNINVGADTNLTSIAPVTIETPLINLGVASTDFILKGNPASIAQWHVLNQSMGVLMNMLSQFFNTMSQDPAFNSQFPAEAGQAAALGPLCQTVGSLCQSFDATIVPGLMISIKTKSV